MKRTSSHVAFLIALWLWDLALSQEAAHPRPRRARYGPRQSGGGLPPFCLQRTFKSDIAEGSVSVRQTHVSCCPNWPHLYTVKGTQGYRQWNPGESSDHGICRLIATYKHDCRNPIKIRQLT
ncbi:hypothetical protein LZ32DRAFT_436111 [Colletotrichum eremochloae]|nr:hypothetical protein LZ32DRAFT_436111 [Colletotrichum eremochloae]